MAATNQVSNPLGEQPAHDHFKAATDNAGKRTFETTYDTETQSVYERGSYANSLVRGNRPAVLVVDLNYGFTDPASPFGMSMGPILNECRRLLDAARATKAPILFTTIAFEPGLRDVGLVLQKVRAASILKEGTRWVEIDDRLGRRPDEPVIVKKGASALFGTNVAAILTAQRNDTVILCGATTSGCIRATAVDLFQSGFPTLVPIECVADRAQGPHQANLFDIQAKYADVVTTDTAIDYLRNAAPTPSSVSARE